MCMFRTHALNYENKIHFSVVCGLFPQTEHQEYNGMQASHKAEACRGFDCVFTVSWLHTA